MTGKTFAVKTRVTYLGLPITVIGTVDGPAIAVAAYATPSELALGVLKHAEGEELERRVQQLVVATDQHKRRE